MDSRYALGLDFGTNSVRVLVVDVRNGRELASAVGEYPSGDAGVILNPQFPDLARQNPADYLLCLQSSINQALQSAAQDRGFSPDRVIGIGVDTTGSTPMPIDRQAAKSFHAARICRRSRCNGMALERPHQPRRG